MRVVLIGTLGLLVAAGLGLLVGYIAVYGGMQ